MTNSKFIENEKRVSSKFFSRIKNTQRCIIKKNISKEEHCVAALGPSILYAGKRFRRDTLFVFSEI